MILAMASTVFQDMFVNKRDKQIFMNMVMFLDRSINEDTRNESVQLCQNLFLNEAINEVIMEVTTKSSFQIMIDAIYDIKPVKDSFQAKSFSEMFAVLHLVTKCEIPFLEMDVKEAIACCPIQETCSDCSQRPSKVPQIGDDGLFRFAAENGDHTSMEDELNIQKCLPCFSFLPVVATPHRPEPSNRSSGPVQSAYIPRPAPPPVLAPDRPREDLTERLRKEFGLDVDESEEEKSGDEAPTKLMFGGFSRDSSSMSSRDSSSMSSKSGQPLPVPSPQGGQPQRRTSQESSSYVNRDSNKARRNNSYQRSNYTS